MTSTLAAAQNTSSEVLDSVTSAVSAGIDLVGDVVPDLAQVVETAVESAVDVVAATSKVAVRLSSKVVRFVTRHPREAVTGFVLVALVMGALGAFKRRRAASAAATTAAAG